MSHHAIAAAIVLAALGCGDLGAEDRGATSGDGGPSADAAGPPSPDAGFDPALMAGDGFPVEGEMTEPSTRGEFDSPASCYDGDAAGGVDDSLADCEDPACAGLASCCVGVGSDLCCAPLASPPIPSLTFDATCTGDLTASCLAGLDVTAFGNPGAWVRDGMLHPGGDDSYDSGLVVGRDVDLTAQRVVVTTTLGLPATVCTDSCLEGAGVAFSSQATFGTSTHVLPLVGLFASGARREVSLLVGDVVAYRWTGEASAGDYTLEVLPSGEAKVTHGAGGAIAVSFPTVEHARLVLYGRNRNQSAFEGIGASIGDLSVDVSLCDMPTSWRGRDALIVRPSPMGTPIDSAVMRAPSVAHDGTRLLMAYQDGPDFYLAGRGGDDTTFILMNEAAPILQDVAEKSDPELVRADGAWWLFYATTDAMGRDVIARAVAPDGAPTAWVFGDATTIAVPEAPVTGLSMPTVVQHPTRREVWVMAARAELADGRPQILLYVSEDGGESFASYAGRTELDELTAALDADEVGGPSLIIHRGSYQLYYEMRRGTRWSIGLLASDELVFWRDPSGGAPVLGGDGNGGDRLSVRHPDPFAAGDEVELFYTGSDGARDALFRAWRLSSDARGAP